MTAAVATSSDSFQASASNRFDRKAGGRKVIHLEWKRVYDHLERAVARSRTTVFSRLVSQFLEQIHDRIFDQDFAGIIQKIAFGDESEVYAETTDERTGYLDDDFGTLEPVEYPETAQPARWKGESCSYTDPVRRAITVEFEIARVEPQGELGKYTVPEPDRPQHCGCLFRADTTEPYKDHPRIRELHKGHGWCVERDTRAVSAVARASMMSASGNGFAHDGNGGISRSIRTRFRTSGGGNCLCL